MSDFKNKLYELQILINAEILDDSDKLSVGSICSIANIPAPEKMPLSLPYFGNTSSASIPITIATQLKGKVEDKPTKFIGCGFGVGLSWGTVAFETDHIVLSDLVEL